MKLTDKNISIGYKCPSCGGTVLGPDGFFSLSGDLFRLKCDCEEGSEVCITRAGGKAKISVPCILCGENHSFTINENGTFSPLVALSCRVSGLEIGFIGTKEDIENGMKKTDRLLKNAVEENGFDSVDAFLCAKRAAKKEAEGLDNEEMTALMTVLAELNDEGDITCHCGKCDDPNVEITSDEVLISCPVCNASGRIPLVKVRDPYALSEIMRIELI